MINLESLRRTIEAAPAEGEALLPVSRQTLVDLEAELRQGRAARAQLAAQAAISGVIGSIMTGAPA